jgi:hypothetical protein
MCQYSPNKNFKNNVNDVYVSQSDLQKLRYIHFTPAASTAGACCQMWEIAKRAIRIKMAAICVVYPQTCINVKHS